MYKNFGFALTQFTLAQLFAGQQGGLYYPLIAFQDVNGTIPADDPGETIAEIADQHTTVEAFTTFYTSDFSAGLDSWTGTQGTAAGNIDSILGRNDCLRLTALGVGGATYLERTLAFFGTTRNRTVISVYVPAAQTYVDGFRVYAGNNTTGTLIYDGASSNGAWVDIDVTKYLPSTTIRVYAYIGTSATINALGVGSLMYVRGMVSSYTNLLNLYQPTLASRPVIGSYPLVGQGRNVRNLFTTATATFTTRTFTTIATPYTLTVEGTNGSTVTLTGTSTAGPITCTGAGNRISLTFTPTAGTLTLTVAGSVSNGQIEFGSSASAYQNVLNAYTISEAGYPSVLMDYYGGSNFLTTGVPSFGTATMVPIAGQAWTVGGVFRSLGSFGSTVSKGTSFNFLTDNGAGSAYCSARGNNIAVGASGIDGRFHAWLGFWDGITLKVRFDGGAPVTISVGGSAASTSNIEVGRLSGGGAEMIGFNHVVNIGPDRVISVTEQNNWFAQMRRDFGTV